MTNSIKGKIVRYSAVGLLDVGAPLIATLTYFPFWVQKSTEATVSGVCVVLMLLSAIPLFKILKSKIQTPSVWFMWALICGLLIALNAIIEQMIVITFVGTISNILGAVTYKYGESIETKETEVTTGGNQ